MQRSFLGYSAIKGWRFDLAQAGGALIDAGNIALTCSGGF
jgi:hypothetical protein